MENIQPSSPRLNHQESMLTQGDSDDYPNFLVILDDKDFTTKYSFRTGKETRADVFDRKLKRKTGSCMVLGLHDARSNTWKHILNPMAAHYMIYAKHPHRNKYIGVKNYHKTLMAEKYDELCFVLNSLGAKSITWEQLTKNNRLYEGPAFLEPELNENNEELAFYKFSPSWQAAAVERLDNWCEQTNVEFIYDDDFGVTDSIVNKMLHKLGVSREVLDPEQHQEDVHHLFKNEKIIHILENKKIFYSTHDKAVVTFFDKEEYRIENVQVINKEWTVDHVEAFLRVIDMVKLVPAFRAEGFNGFQLINLSKEDPVSVALKYKMTLPETEDLFNCIDDLGVVDNLELVKMINSEFDMLKTEQGELLRQQKSLEDLARHRKAMLPHPWQVLNNTKGAGVISDDFDVIFIGRNNVGKTSIIKAFELVDFDPDQPSTTGVSPSEQLIGLSKIRFWDMNGTVMQSSTTEIKPERINVIVLVYDVTNWASFQWLKVVLETLTLENSTHALLLGNKLDLVEDEYGDPDLREVYEQDAEELCESFGIDSFMEVSACTGQQIHEAIADAILKSDQIKYLAAKKKKKGLSLSDKELDWGYSHRTIHLFPMCVPKPKS